MHKFAQLISSFEGQGFTFSSLTLTSSGKYHPFDAEWNYKDVPHLHEIHQLVEGIPYKIERDMWVGFFLQKVGPLTVPLSVFNTSPSRNENHYFAAAGPFVLLITSEWDDVGEQTTEVRTTYLLGSKTVWKPFRKFVLSRLKSNYRELMRGDIPMRTRRGLLRAAGIEFATDEEGIGFDSSRELSRSNLIPSKQLNVPIFSDRVNLGDHSRQRLKMGDPIFGVVIDNSSGAAKIFPRTCSHDGASLDEAALTRGCLKCPWHGKLVRPLVTIEGESSGVTFEVSGISVRKDGSTLEVDGAVHLFGELTCDTQPNSPN